MTYSIALAGKGGTGKTTMAGFLIRYLSERGRNPILAVDADANANLNEVLGLEVNDTLGNAREEMKTGVSSGMTKDVFMEMKLQEAVIESDDFDLVVMGRPEGPGCYCAANSLLVQYLDKLIGNYASVVIDNEAGMEHLSRLTTNNIDVLLLISDSTRRGMQAAARISEIADELNLNIGKKRLVVNQAKEEEESTIRQMAADFGLEIAGIVMDDPDVRAFDLNGRPTLELTGDNKALKQAFQIFDTFI
ncbi:MAG: AAA family ATPase [Desulfatiglans sp.]|jgi:CO dehydrogenase maturation factor|nr:AAA family ATPase [Desulfatiglans sp.]